MKLRSLGLALALVVCLQTAAQAEESTPLKYGPPAPPAPIAAKPQLGTEVPQIGMLAKKTGYSLAALTLMFLLATGTIKRFSKRGSAAKSAHQIEVVARKNLGPRQALLVVSIDGRKFFLAQGNENVTLISELNDELIFGEALGDSFEILEEAKSANFKS